jgi:hypothetical protein
MSLPFSDMTPDLPESKASPADRVYERPGESLHLGLVLQISVFVVVAALLMLLAPEAPWSIRLLIIALVMLTLKRWGGVLVLMLVQGDLVLREGRDMAILKGSGGVLFVLVVMGVLMFVARQRELLQQIARSSLLQVAREFLNSGEAPAESPKEFSVPAARIFSSALRGITLLFGCVVDCSRRAGNVADQSRSDSRAERLHRRRSKSHGRCDARSFVCSQSGSLCLKFHGDK